MNNELGIKELKSRPPAQRQWMRRVFAFTVSIILASLFIIPISSAGALETGIDFGTATGLSTQDIRVTVAKIIRAAFGLLGIVGLGIVLAGGFLWMTSSGNEEKLAKAKQLLTNGAIGLTIMLLSFAITQFVISRLTSALYGSGAVTIATEGGGGLPPGALPGGCVDPGGVVPFVCTISPTSGPVGAYITIRGYRFAPHVDGSSSVRIGGVLAPVVACGGGANWADNLIVVEVPTLEAGRSHPVQVTAGGGGVSGNPVVFGVTADPVGPQIACIVPNQGPEGTILSIDGKNFGAERGTADVRFGGGVSVTSITSWIDTAIGTSIPAGAQSGDVTVVRDTQTSNGYPLTVTCSAGTQCSVSNCCTQGQCVEASACAPGGPPATVGASCDGNTATPACEPVACGGGLRCESSACTCQEGPVITSVSPQTLVSTTDGIAYRRTEDVPAGTQTVIAPNGAPGNYLSIRGSGFGATPGSVIFLGAEGATDDVGATLAACTTAWSDQQVVIAIPVGAALGPIQIKTVDPQFFDATDDARGTAIEHFRPNTTQRPGVCAVTPAAGQIGATVTMAGVQFGASRGAEDAVLFGDLSSGATSAWGATAITTVVPILAEGSVPVRVRASGELSNEVGFTREAEPRVPRIQEIIPAAGGPGQYVTIRGEHFGSEIGKLMFRRGTDEYEVLPRFPDLCAQNWWRDTEITARIPANTGEWGPPAPIEPPSFNALGTYEVRVRALEGATLRSSNALSFEVTADQPSPGICAIAPSSGPAMTPVQIIGERFGGAVGAIQLFDGIAAAIGDGGAHRAGNFLWADGLVRGLLVPGTAQTGPVRLWPAGQSPTRDDDSVAPGLQGNQGSNPVTFEVRDCRAGGTSACAARNICCGNGTCVATAAACAAGPNRGSFQWTFATGVIPKVPRVVESCVPADASAIPSPSPWDQQGQGQEVCVNANIAVRFTASMGKAPSSPNGSPPPLDAAGAEEGIQVFRCGGGSNAAAALGGGFEGASLASGWTVVDGTTSNQSTWLSASAETVVAPATAHGGTGVLKLEKRVATAPYQTRTIDLPRDAPVDRHYFAITAPSSLISDTNGTTYTARVFVRGENPNANPNMRAGIVVGRLAGDTPTDVGWYQQVANEVTLNGTWQELSAAVTFDAGLNNEAPGFVRLYLTGPPIGAPAAADDTYTARFDDLEVVRQGDACATRVEVDGLTFFPVASEGGRLQLANNIVTVAPAAGSWMTGTWYEVLLYGDDTTIGSGSGAIEKRAFRSAGTPQLRLDGDKDGVEGGNYRFRFRTRTSAAACAIQSAVTTPSDAVATQRGPAAATALTGPNASHPGLVHLRADGRADPAACFTLATSSMDWSWTTVQPAAGSAFASVDSDGQGRWCRTSDECAVVSCATAAACAPFGAGTACVDGRCAVNFCSANRCTFVPATPAGAPNLFSNTKTARGIRETPLAADGSPQPVEVRATVAAATPRTGTSNVVVRFEKPRVTAVYPTASCQAACPNGRVVAVTNIDLDPDTVTTGTTETTETVKLYACNQENCRRDELTAVGGTTIAAAACAASPPAGSFCATNKVGADPQIIISGVTPLETNKSYRVVIRDDVRSAWGVPLDQLNYADNASGALDSYSWTFRTRSEPCVVSRVDVSPSPLVLNVIGERATVRAVPFGQPDACSPAGQPLDAEAMDWVWSIANPPPGVVAQFTTVNSAGAFTAPASDQLTRTSRVAGPSCTLQCLRPGSRRVPGICGNGVTETPAEECERTGGAFASWCDPATCLLKGAKPEADGGTCGNGVINDGEECEEVGPDGALSATGQFPVWCDPATCLNRGSVVGGSVCGNGNAATPVVSAGDGEDCDDGNTNGGDGCSSTCLAEGTPRQYHATEAPNGILARCGDGVVADGQGTPPRPDGGEECDPGAVPRAIWTSQGCDYDRCVRTGARSIAEEITPGVFGTCGNGAVDVLKGEQCDDGAVGICNAASDVNAGRRCSAATSAADCGGASRCEELQPMDGDGCASNCLFEGSSIAWRHARTNAVQPSMCGDGYQPPERGEACDLGGITGPPDPLQIIQAIGSGTANAEGTQITAVTATVNGVPGPGEIRLQCGYESDVQCPNPDSVPAGIGVDRQGCCRARPTIAARIPGPATTGVCRNARITVRFDQQMDTGSLGAVTDLATGSSFMKGAVLERCKAGTACRSDVSADWETISAVPALSDAIIAVAGQDRTVSELSFTLTSALNPSTVYRVRVLDTSDDTAAQQLSIRSADGVRLGDATGNTWTFTTGTQVCTVSRIDVIPPSYLLQRRESRATLRAQAIAQTPAGEAAIDSIASTYAWNYAWSSNAIDITTTDSTVPQYTCGTGAQCAFKPAEPTKNGDAIGIATAAITENVFAAVCTATNATTVCGAGRSCANGHCVGESFTGRSRLRALICENPWPPVTSPATWEPYPQPGSCSNDPPATPRRSCFVDADCTGGGAPCTGGDIASLLVPERLSIAYCRDQGDRKVCRDPGQEETISARTCAQDTDCTDPQKCLPALSDDLPAFQAAPVNPLTPASSENRIDELRKEFFFLPREITSGVTVTYCSVSGERCDPTIAGMCPAGEFCRAGNDAVGLRIYENEEHVAAPRWFAKQNFTEGTTPVDVDGYRGVQAGRTTYLNVANVGSVYTNMIVLSVNDGAVAETRMILNQILQGIRFNTNLATENERVCAQRDTPTALVGRCSGSRALCSAIGSACAGENAGTCEVVACSSDLDCRWTPPTGTPFANGVCRSPKDKLARDVRRLEDLNEIRIAIETSGRARARCSVTPQSCDPTVTPSTCPSGETCFTSGPILAAGTFVPGLTTSRWPSWRAELGSAIGASALPVDPLNAFGGACAADPDGYDDATCWNVTSGTYSCPAGSYLYQYRQTTPGQWTVSGVFEYTRDSASDREWLPALPPTIDARHVATSGGVCGVGTTGASAYQAYSATGSCGDGVSQGGEACDPPGSTEQQVCTTVSGASGFRVRTCQQSCTWTEPNTTWSGGSPTSPCVTACGNFVRDGAEACDVGPTGGNVPVGHPTSGIIPGISTGTQYECSAVCAWGGGYCGDSIAQSLHGEQCDGVANIATTPTQSSSTTQYACTPATDANPCKGVGGFCGDGTIQTANAEQCDGDQARSCIDGDGNLRDAEISGGGTLVGGSLPWRTEGAYSRIRFDNITIQDQGGANGSIRITLETSNDPGNLSNLTRDQIEVLIPGSTTNSYSINDYNPQGAQGGAGLYHRLRIETKPAGEDVSTYVVHGTMWALASLEHQTTSMVIDSMPSGARDLRIEWENDWSSSSFDSNLMLHRVTLEGQQVRRCHASGANACEWNGGWQACQAAGALCGNGTVNDGEECDDGGKGRCANELTKVCASNAECTGGACERDVDSCTSECKRNVCGDARQLAPTCTAGNPSDIGKSCTSTAQCGATGLCAVEQCDLGTSNWRAQCTGPSDPRCVPNAVCEYGRTCNYCVIGSCGVATKQGGFCGDRVKNGPELCDFIDGTNQCTGLSGTARTNCQAAVGVANLDWRWQICGVACDATCPPSSIAAPLRFGGTTSLGSTLTAEAQFSAGNTRYAQVDACRLLDAFRYDVELGSGVDVWPVPVSVVVVTDRSGSMYREVTADCDGDGVTNVAGACSGGDRIGQCTDDDECLGTPNGTCDGETINDDDDHRMRCTRNAIKGGGGLLDKLAIARDPGDVRVALVSYGTTVQTDSELRDVATPTERQALKDIVSGYNSLGNTATHLAIDRAAEILNADTSAQTKVIILLSDGIANNMTATTTAATAFKALGGHRYLFTIAYPIPRPGMTGWSSNTSTDTSFAFSGDDLESFYEQIVGAIAGVSITLLPGGSGDSPSAVTYVNRTQTGMLVDAGSELAGTCAMGGQPTTYRVRVNFRVRPGSASAGRHVWLRNPSALVCSGPPWAPGD